MDRAGLVGEQMLQLAPFIRGPIPDDVVAAVAGTQIVVGSGDRIAQALLARRQTESHVTEQFAMDRACKCRLRNERAPRDVTGIERRQLRETLLADGRTKSIRADQKIA